MHKLFRCLHQSHSRPIRRPSCLRYNHSDVVVLQGRQGSENGVDLGIEVAEIMKLVTRIHNAGVLPKQSVV
ncbi:hypothetical protein CICLE_v10017390mg [Citrus x clementina]|uniref:Uncharacterized protein n=1 Tax=Citrus clementina TaxID=85681 RepID=V4W3I6_CITCL|nr:hypothetical protein CICLE_v10017390mg [Citrus x clementina]